jgi:hypothetical protein
MNDEQQACAILYGLALGDALGWPIEFLKMNKIGIIYGESGIKEPPNPAAFTDETQIRPKTTGHRATPSPRRSARSKPVFPGKNRGRPMLKGTAARFG